jgi:hypothetical protein
MIGSLTEKMEASDDDESPKRSGIAGMLNGMIENPDIQRAIASKIMGWIGVNVPARGPAKVAGMAGQSVLLPGQPEKVQQALNILAGCDPELGDHLLGVAKIAQDDPGKYKWIVKML